MYLSRSGSIVNIGSDLSVVAPNQNIYKKTFGNYVKPATYSIIKHAMLGMTKYFSSLYGKYNIRVNMLSQVQYYLNKKKVLIKNLLMS